MANVIDGYKPIPDSGTPVPYPCGTEETAEAKAPANTRWAKRKFTKTEGPPRSGEYE